MAASTAKQRQRLLDTLVGGLPPTARVAAATLDYLQKKFGIATPGTAWKFLMASITYFHQTPGGALPMVPNVTDQARVWNKSQSRPAALYSGAERIAYLLAADFGVNPSTSNWIDLLENRLSTYFKLRAWAQGEVNPQRRTGRLLNNSQQRNTWVGDGFEHLLYVLAQEFISRAGLEGLEVRTKVPPEHIVGFQLRLRGGRQRFPESDLTIQNAGLLRAVVSAKVGLRADRSRGEVDAALTLARIRPEAYYLIVTAEYDTAFLRLLASEPAVGRVYHVSKRYLLEFWDKLPKAEDELPWIQSSIGDLKDFFDDVMTIGESAV